MSQVLEYELSFFFFFFEGVHYSTHDVLSLRTLPILGAMNGLDVCHMLPCPPNLIC